MAPDTYFQVLHDALEHYNEGRMREAFDIVERHEGLLAENPAQMLNLKYCIAARMGEPDLAMRILRDSLIGTDCWWGYDYFFQDEDLISIRDRPEFKELALICKERETAARASSKATLKIMPSSTTDAPVDRFLIALHGNGDGVALTGHNWYPVIDRGMSLALPQSSQLQYHGTYTWQDIEKGTKELLSHIADLRSRYGMVEYVLGGFSGGSRLSLNAVLHAGLRPSGLILVGPWYPELKEWSKEIEKMGGTFPKTCILCGERDKLSLDMGNELAEVLTKLGLPNRIEVVAGLGHDFPSDFPERLARMLEFFDE